ncbi:prepilin-type N-terminal cleavage/methylation domain-containing protein [Luteimonas sp. YGD11-2]|uniref:PulJ/GspJ family protein n=1 Tax=Luteimonas sp. YGD11-2 TaxID=2508168 RepID=UPI0019D6BB97|nr:prepilin-type N-terminal cleavage/methylation domain-containing protein [Luteimonas sp. YGD11-2]
MTVRACRPPVRARATGFTLLEAIVAMVVMATSLLALYSWLSTSTFALTRAQAQARSLEDARTALALVEDINPFEHPRGERDIGPLQVRWQATELTERRPGLSSVGFPTQFDFILYDVEVEALRDERVVRTFNFRKAGWEITRPINLEEE